MMEDRGEFEPAEYEAAVEGAAVMDRSSRGRLTVSGRAPAEMLGGVVTNRIPPLPRRLEGGVWTGQGSYGAILTPKGKMVADLRIFRRWAGDEGALFLDLPPSGVEGAKSHLMKYLPPRMAKLNDVSGATGMLTLLGPEGAALLAREVAGLRVGAEEIAALSEDQFILLAPPGGEEIRVVRCGDVSVPAFDVLAGAPTIRTLRERFAECGAASIGDGVWTTLRLEGGRPAYGRDMDDATIPIEAGIDGRAIDHGKGCYTGQEVIVRIRHRGRVNWNLRGFLLGKETPPPPGAELYRAGEGKAVGRVTSAAHSPRFGETIALGYARREVEVGTELRLGNPDGPPARVREVGDEGWVDG